jgi:hypothetical protein
MKALSLSLTLLAITTALAGPENGAPYHGSAEFERMKSLAGTWKGTHDMGKGPMELTVVYKVVAGGSAVEERFFAGTPNEMVTMYHDKQGKLSLTHYCMLHNQPGMMLKAADDKKIEFDFDPTCGLDDASMHMHSLVITFKDADHISQDWKLFENGKAKDSHPFSLKRVKA